jgi:hypothetical protein
MKWKKVKNFPARSLAEQAKDILEKEGIPAMIKGEDIGMFGPGIASTALGVNLLVPEEYYEKAFELIDSLYNGI